MPRRGRYRVGVLNPLTIVGLLIMLVGAGFSAVPMATISIDGISLTGISPFSASLIFVGLVVFAAGVSFSLRRR